MKKPVRRSIQRPGTCCSSRIQRQDSNGARQQQAAWMAFHKKLSFTSKLTEQQTVATPMSWPGCARPAAGLGTLEASYRQTRLISTAQPERRSIYGKRLPPIYDSQKSKLKDTGRGSQHKRNLNSQKQENNGFSARKWANCRPTQIYNDTVDIHKREMQFQNQQDFKRAFPVPRQKRRETVVRLGEREAASLRRLQGIYANTKEKTLRAERIQQTLKALQDKTLHREMDESLREYKKRVEIDKGNRLELKRVRDNYYKDKRRRNSRTHLSLNALETPHVSRLAYGLPEEGKEFEETQLVHKTEERLQEIWKKAVRRAIVIDKLLKHNANTNQENIHLPKIVVKRTPLGKIHKHVQDKGSPNQPHQTNHTDLIDVEMADLDAISSVSGSDIDDDLTDIGEED